MLTLDSFVSGRFDPPRSCGGQLGYASIGSVGLLLIVLGIAGCGSKPLVAEKQSPIVPPLETQIDLTGQTDVDAKLAKMQEELKETKSLVLHRTDVTGAGLRNLKVATRLRTLDLRETAITDLDLQNLRGMAQLLYLVLDDSRVTDQGIAAVRKFLPRTVVTPAQTTN